MKQRPEPPARTAQMITLGQIWAWIWDKPKADIDTEQPGHWEVRGTGVVDDQVPVGKHWRFL